MSVSKKLWLCGFVVFMFLGLITILREHKETLEDSDFYFVQVEDGDLDDFVFAVDGEFFVSPPCPQKKCIRITDGITNVVFEGSGTNYFANDDVLILGEET